MRRIGVIVALAGLLLFVGGASANDIELVRFENYKSHQKYANYEAVSPAKARIQVSLRPPPLKLPNIGALTLQLRTADRSALAPQLVRSKRIVRFFQSPKHRWFTAPRQEKCWAVPWQRLCTKARAVLRLHQELASIAQTRLDFEISATDNWVRAMGYAQRPFPGTLAWLEFISNRECRACWTTPGGFVCNYEGSGACGPMQFMSGTFYGHADDARAWLKDHHYIVDESTWAWQNPLGQALTAAYMRYTHQDGCHWCL